MNQQLQNIVDTVSQVDDAFRASIRLSILLIFERHANKMESILNELMKLNHQMAEMDIMLQEVTSNMTPMVVDVR